MNTLTTKANETITLYFCEGRSDKVYQCAIEPTAEEKFSVTFAYGRRGSTLNTGTKTGQPVEYEEAKRVFDRLVQEKMAKGYTPGPDGTPYVSGSGDKQPSGLLPQLLNPIDESDLERLIHDTLYCAQEKFDGRRMLLRKHGVLIEAINRKGLIVAMPDPVRQAFNQISVGCVLDGESIGDAFHAFDVLELDGCDLRTRPYRERLTALMNLLASVQQRVIRFTETAYTREQKTRLLTTLQKTANEGIVFKRLDATYTAGRPNSGGPQLKYKFCATLSAVVAMVNARRSVEIRLLGKDGWQPAGNVTIPVNETVPIIGQVVEIKYLYAFPESGCLFQPVYLGKRTDVQHHECMASQLKFKPAEEA